MERMPAPQTLRFSGNLDLLRSFAVMSVYFSHLYITAFRDGSFRDLGRFGVIIFFVHTSCVLMASLERLEQSDQSDLSLTLAFWVRRFFRIYPLAILCVIFVAVVHVPILPLSTYQWIGWKAFAYNLSLTQNLSYYHNIDIIGPLWSLPLEVQMYVLLPFGYFAIRGGRRYRSLGLWVLSVALALLQPRIWLLHHFAVLLYAPSFTSGIVAFDLIRSRQGSFKLPAWTWPIGILALIIAFGPHNDVSLINKRYRIWALSLVLGVFYSFVREGRSHWCNHIFHWIAEHSYGIYLSHAIVLWFVFNRMHAFSMWLRIPILIILSAGVPVLLYRSVEKPLIVFGGNIARRILGRPEAIQNPEPVAG